MQTLYHLLRGRTMRERRARIGYLFILPSLFFVVVVLLLPAGYNIYLSFTEWHVVRPTTFIGLENYRAVLDSRDFIRCLKQTLYFTTLSVPGTILLALLAALGLHRVGQRPGSSLVRALYFMPVVASLTAVAYIWAWMLNPAYGLFNEILRMFSLPPLDWLNSVQQVIPSLSLMQIWARLGFNMLILLAGLSTIPPDFYEAADIDGANKLQSFWHITLPLLNRQLVLVLIVEMMTALKVFELPYAATGGGPVKASRTLVMYIYETGFHWTRMGEAAVASIFLFGLILLITLVQQKLFARGVSY